MLKFKDFFEMQQNGQDTQMWIPKLTQQSQVTKQTGDQDENQPPLADVIQNVFNQMKQQQIAKSKVSPLKYVQAPQPQKKSGIFSRIASKFKF